MTYITGYKNGKGPYITAAASGYGGTGSNKNVARDILIWGLSIRNTGSTAGEKLIIYENAASTDHASSVDSDFIVFENYLDAGDHTGDLEGYLVVLLMILLAVLLTVIEQEVFNYILILYVLEY